MTLGWFAKRLKPETELMVIEYVSMRYISTITAEQAINKHSIFHDIQVVDWDFTKDHKVYI